MERTLLESARRVGLGQGEAVATIRSGIDAGMLQPRDLNGVGHTGPPPSKNGDGHREPEPADDRPAIEVTTERHDVLEEALRALARDRDLYRRGDSLGIVVEEGKPAAKLTAGIELRNAQGSARFIALSDANVSCYLTRNARFFRWKADRNGEPVTVDCHPPDWLIQAIASRGYWPGIRPLLTVTSCPFVRLDGSVPAPGYDDATGALFRPNVELRSLPDRPTRGDAREATKRLYHLVRQFPFASDSDRAVWLAALLTAVQRPTIAGPVPGFAFNGNKAGIGKGLLIDTIGVLAWGHCIPTRTYPADPVEAGKVKLSLALAAIAAVHFDNLPEGGLYGNSELDSALTLTQVGGRILGQSRETGPVPLRPLWTLSGNNVSPSRDAYRRSAPLPPPDGPRIPPRTRQPRRSRPAGDRPNQPPRSAPRRPDHPQGPRDRRPSPGRMAPVGSFEEWDQIIHGAVWYATDEDCLTTQRHAAAESPERLEKLALLEGWSQLPDGTDRGLRSRRPFRPSRGTPRRIPCSTPHSCGSPRMGRCPASTGSATGSGPWAGRTTVD